MRKEDGTKQATAGGECGYQSLTEPYPKVIITLTPDGKIKSLNKAFEQITGWTIDKWVDRPFARLIHPEDMDLAMGKFQQALKREKMPLVQLRIISKSGRYLSAELIRTARVKQGRIVEVLGIGHYQSKRKPAEEELELRVQERTLNLRRINEELKREIAERKQLEQALRDNFEHLSKKNRYETIIGTITRSVHRSISLQEVLENAVNTMNENIDKSKNVCIYLVEGTQAVMKTHRGLPDWFIKRAGRIPYPKGFTWKTIEGGKPIYCTNIEQDTLIGPAGRELGTKSYLSIPIQFEGKTVGVINIHSMQGDPFDEEDINLLEIVAQQIGVAINNARQAEALRESEERYRALYEDNPSMYFTVDVRGKILSVNRFGLEQLGYSANDLVGKSVLNIFTEDDRKALLEQIAICLASPGQVNYWEFRKIRKQGDVMWVREAARSMRDAEGNTVILIVCEDITEQKRAEEHVKTSLREKELLLKEVHHRVKNNLQIISSLLDLQSQYIRGKRTLQMFHDTCSRVKSMALIHEQLHQSRDLAKIDFGEYIRSLGGYLFRSYGISPDFISLEVETDGICLDVDTAITCGLIVNELVTNSLKHAFSDARKTKNLIKVGLSSSDANKFTLSVSDNGVGFPKHLNFKKTEDLGLQLVSALAGQLDANLTLYRRRGSRFTISFQR